MKRRLFTRKIYKLVKVLRTRVRQRKYLTMILEQKYTSNMVEESKYGRMEQSMMVTGAMEWRKVKEIFTTQMVMFTQVNSIRIELMVSEFMFIKMGKLMKDSGEMICKMVQEKKN